MQNNDLEKIIKIVKIVLNDGNIEAIDTDKDLIEYGLDSLLFIRMAILLEEEFEIQLPESHLFIDEMNSLNKILSIIHMCR